MSHFTRILCIWKKGNILVFVYKHSRPLTNGPYKKRYYITCITYIFLLLKACTGKTFSLFYPVMKPEFHLVVFCSDGLYSEIWTRCNDIIKKEPSLCHRQFSSYMWSSIITTTCIIRNIENFHYFFVWIMFQTHLMLYV